MKIIECPRDAMQGINRFIATDLKVDYINMLLKVGFDTLDFGSFVSHTSIPQMRDTHEVVERINWETSQTKLLAIVANERGANEALEYDQISYLGFPLSLSETFQKRNTNKTIEQAFSELERIQMACRKRAKTLVVYLSMGFGNPYNDPYDIDMVIGFVESLKDLHVNIISLSDTIGVSNPQNISYLFESLILAFPDIEFGAHLHSTPATSLEKIDAAYKAGCRRFDGALGGYGGCPMAKDELTGNLATEAIIDYLKDYESLRLDIGSLKESIKLTTKIFT